MTSSRLRRLRAIVLGPVFIGALACETAPPPQPGPAVSAQAAAPSSPAPAAPAPDVPLDDARLYIPPNIQGFEAQSRLGFLGGTPNSPAEARMSITTDKGSMVFLATRSTGTLAGLGATGAIGVKVAEYDGIQTPSGAGWSTRWKRGDVLLSVLYEEKGVPETKLKEGCLGLAVKLNGKADEVVKMTPGERQAWVDRLYPSK